MKRYIWKWYRFSKLITQQSTAKYLSVKILLEVAHHIVSQQLWYLQIFFLMSFPLWQTTLFSWEGAGYSLSLFSQVAGGGYPYPALYHAAVAQSWAGRIPFAEKSLTCQTSESSHLFHTLILLSFTNVLRGYKMLWSQIYLVKLPRKRHGQLYGPK